MKKFPVFVIIYIALLAIPIGVARAHAFPEHAEPGAGAELYNSPKIVRIRFDRTLEAAFSTLRVEDAAGKRVHSDAMHFLPGRSDTIEVKLPPLASGRYHVYWRVVARDGHRTSGDYVFVVH